LRQRRSRLDHPRPCPRLRPHLAEPDRSHSTRRAFHPGGQRRRDRCRRRVVRAGAETVTVLVVGAGAGGGYIGDRLIAAGRDVTFLVRPHTLSRLSANGLRLRDGAGLRTVDVNAVVAADLHTIYDVIIVAVRASAVESAIEDIRPAVGAESRI